MDDFDFRNYNQSVSKISVLLLNAGVFTCYFASMDFAGAGTEHDFFENGMFVLGKLPFLKNILRFFSYWSHSADCRSIPCFRLL